MPQDKKLKKRAFIFVAVFLIVLIGIFLLFTPWGSRILSPEKNINILLITLDAARADFFSFNNPSSQLMPNVNQLIKAGAVFKNAYCTSGSTPPSMGAIFTSKVPYWPSVSPDGKPVWRPETVYGLTRFFDEGEIRPGIPASIDTLPKILQRHGYTTVGIITNPYLSKDFRFHRNFDFFEELKTSSPYGKVEEVTQKTVAYLTELKEEKIFIWAHLMDLHMPLLDYSEFLDEAKTKRIQVSIKPVSEWTPWAKQIIGNFGAANLPDWTAGEENLIRAANKYILAYNALFLRVDRQIGIIMDTLRELGLWEKTLIIILNDHGDEFMEHGELSHWGQLYEEIVKGVWIMHNPELFPTPVSSDALVSHLDFTPTLLDLLNIRENFSSFDGISQKPLFKQKQPKTEEIVFGLQNRTAFIIINQYKLILFNAPEKINPNHANPQRSSLELYDLKNDPKEQHNLAKQSPQIVERLYVKLKNILKTKGIHFWSESSQSKEISKDTLERLKALGYIH